MIRLIEMVTKFNSYDHWFLVLSFNSIFLSWNSVPGGSAGKESTCDAGDSALIPASGRFPGEGIGYSLQYSWASLVAQLVKNLPAMWETWVWSLDCEDPLEKGKATPLQYSGLENSMDCIVYGVAKSRIWLSDFHFHPQLASLRGKEWEVRLIPL